MVDYQTARSSASMNLPPPGRVLAIGAHPDDAEFGAGATLAKWAAGGAETHIVVLTDGSKGTWDSSMKPDLLAAIRSQEQAEASRRLGVTGGINLGLVDGELEYSLPLREQICGLIRRLRPDVVLTHDPWRRYLMHPDHRVTGWAVVDGVVAARDPLFYTKQLKGGRKPHRPEVLLLWATDQPDHWEDATGFLETKVSALLAHSSQTATTMDNAGQSPQATESFRQEIFDRARRAAESGLTEAEAFKKLVP